MERRPGDIVVPTNVVPVEKTRRARRGMGLVIVAVLAVFVLGVNVLQGAAASVGKAVTVIDDLGRRVTLSHEPERIISIAPSNTEILFALGLGDRIVGVTDSCDYPADAKTKPKVGAVQLDYEKIVATCPDLVVAVGSLQRQAIAKLSELGVTVLAVDPKSVDGVLHAITLIGKATGVEGRASEVVKGLSARMERLAQKLSGLAPSERPRVFVEIWNEPLMTAGPGTFVDELVSAAGGRNIAHDARAEWPEFSEEAVIERDPEVVVLTNFNKVEALARPAWQRISAYKTGRVYEVNPDLLVRPGPRLVDGLETLAAIFHPDLFR
ncbi:MAG: ABC transporter substrate-binding protein [Clostridia bacterium]